LLANDLASQALYGTIPTHGNESKNGNEVAREHQRKRLEEQGWLAYIKEFGVFLPCLLPTRDVQGKLCITILILDLVINRFLRVLTP